MTKNFQWPLERWTCKSQHGMLLVCALHLLQWAFKQLGSPLNSYLKVAQRKSLLGVIYLQSMCLLCSP